MKVLFLTTIPSPYRVAFFNELGKKCNLVVPFEKKQSDERDQNWKSENFENFDARFLRGVKTKVNKAFCPGIIKVFKQINPDIVLIGGYNTPTAMLLIEYLNYKKCPFILNADGGFIKNDNKFISLIKTHYISSAQYYIGTSKNTMEYFVNYGANKEFYFQYPFTSIKKNQIITKSLQADEKKRIKNDLNINENKMILMVGQFIRRKGIDVLLNACKDISNDVGVYIIGGKETEEYQAIIQSLCIKNVHFLDFMAAAELRKYYLAADLFVLPTREDVWGLVINEAIACGLPVITTDRCIAGIEMIEHNINGYIVPVEDYKNLTRKIKVILDDDCLRSMMAQNNIEKAHEYSLENMAEMHYQIFKSFLSGRGR